MQAGGSQVDTNDAAELIAELKEDRAEHASEERFNRGAAMLIAVLAAVLAVGGLGGGNATDDMIISNIRASDTWAFYQAKNVRQTMYELEVAELESRRARDEARIAAYKATIARYDDEPDPSAPDDPLRGEGKKQLSRRRATSRSPKTTTSTSPKWRFNSRWCSVRLRSSPPTARSSPWPASSARWARC
jgi:hypothetical protein